MLVSSEGARMFWRRWFRKSQPFKPQPFDTGGLDPMPQFAHPTLKVISDWFAWQNRKRFHVVKSDRDDQ
jgi:hypothetical protein